MFPDDSTPLVSCIMPTYNRRDFVPHAIHYFLRQDYPQKELIIVDDGSDTVKDLIPADDRIRYYFLPKKTSLGTKLNLACESAKGEIIANWDDDDWYAPWRLNYQVETIQQGDVELCGINRLLYLDLRSGDAYQYVYPAGQRIWLAGSSLCYSRKRWSRKPFEEINVGMDGLFTWATSSDLIRVLPDSRFSVHTIHARNISPKQINGFYWHRYPVQEIQKLLGEDWRFYQKDSIENARPSARNASIKRVLSKTSKPVRNIFACLVHESRECVIDLVRNLRYHDPSSTILLYNGGKDPNLLANHFPFENFNAVVHPSTRQMTWGRLHDFALDCMEFCLDHFSFDAITMIDSDQLAVRSGYSHFLADVFSKRSKTGLLGSAEGPQKGTRKSAPAQFALSEIDLWRPFLRRFPDGESKFVHWTFWPSTVFTESSARDLVKLFRTDERLQEIMGKTRIWATEEVVLPTMVALLGYEVVSNPCSYDYVKYQTRYSPQQIDRAIVRPDVFWMHPIPRLYEHPLRKHIRQRFNQYDASKEADVHQISQNSSSSGLLLTRSILQRMQKIEGWLEEDEADLLIAITLHALRTLPMPHNIVEIGSYCGRSTVVIGSVARIIQPDAKIFAVDPHDGKVGALDEGIIQTQPTLEKFKRNIASAGLVDIVKIIQKKSYAVVWDQPVSLLFIDGLHDYANVSQDFFHFERWIVREGYIAFHDYAPYYPGVQAFVNELLESKKYRKIQCERSMMVVQKL